MTDQLIERLVADLKPQEPLINFKLWSHCSMCLLIVAGLVLAVLGLRADYSTALQNGAMLWKPGMFLLAWIGSMFLILDFPMLFIVFPLLLSAEEFRWQCLGDYGFLEQLLLIPLL